MEKIIFVTSNQEFSTVFNLLQSENVDTLVYPWFRNEPDFLEREEKLATELVEKFSTLSVAVAVKDNLAKEILERIFNLPDDSKVVCVIFPPEFIDAVQVEIKKITDKKIVFLCPPKTPSVFEKKTENKAKSRWIRKNGKIFEINTETGEYELCA